MIIILILVVLLLLDIIKIFTRNLYSSKKKNSWEKKLIHVHYNGEKVISRCEHYGLSKMFPNHASLSSKIVGVALCTIDLDYPWTEKLKLLLWTYIDRIKHKEDPIQYSEKLAHHFIEVQTQCGHHFSIEKTRFHILLQSCYAPPDVDDTSVTNQRDGLERPKLNSLKRGKNTGSTNLKKISINDFVDWLMYQAQAVPYDIVVSNCQHFARDCWKQLVDERFPDPVKRERPYSKFCTRLGSMGVESGKVTPHYSVSSFEF